MSERQVRELLRLFSESWARQDVPALLRLFTPDAVYAASIGPEPGTTFRGHGEIAAGLAIMFAHDEGARATQRESLVLGDAAVTTWTYSFANGRPSQHGVDLWRFRDGRIATKDAYRKVALQQEPTNP